ncbi:MAG: hypothetical protein PVG79_16025 [Gemmatimonadales bacterium]
MNDLTSMQALLRAYRDLSECIVERIAWRDFGTTVAITFRYIWKEDGRLRGRDDERLWVELTFKLVQEFHLRNSLTPQVAEDPSVIDWGRTEVAWVQILEDESSMKYDGYPLPFFHAEVRWEGRTWMDIVFAELEVCERADTSAPA